MRVSKGWFFWVGCFCLFCLGCTESTTKPPEEKVRLCSSDDECPPGFTCQESYCVKGRTPPPPPKKTDEICNGKDDDGDGRVDNVRGSKASLREPCYTGPWGTLRVGECRGGRRICEQGKWSSCQAQVLPQAEKCSDGKDNDCDGALDNGCPCKTKSDLPRPCYPGHPDTRGVGLCKPGSQPCQGGYWSSCQGAILPQPEQCDGKDNDCNGQVDDGLLAQSCYSGSPQTANVGLCRSGLRHCQKGKWSSCQGEVTPQTEKCDQVDNNCDGQIDEGCSCTDGRSRPCYGGPAGTINVGACKAGVQVCLEGKWGDCRGEITPSAEKCDGQDNDCNGKIDDRIPFQYCYSGAASKLGIGICKAGRRYCKGGQWSPTCEGEVPPAAEICDGRDNNCNGTTDEGCPCQLGEIQPCYSASPATRGVGLCKSGLQHCGSSGTWGPCQDEVAPSPEVCDGKDNDCNGQIDDNIPSAPCTATEPGECQQGQSLCQQGQPYCQAGAKKKESCDGKDNDCDGQSDEDLFRPCYPKLPGCQQDASGLFQCKGLCGTGKSTCQNGAWGACTGATTPATEVCNDGKDNDCDGVIDNGCACTNGQSRPCYPGTQGCSRQPNGSYTCRGACQAGTQSCQQDQWTPCQGFQQPATESCGDKIDNDCNGQIDETCPCTNGESRPCYTGASGCTRGASGQYSCHSPCKAGLQYCRGGQWDPLCNGQQLPVAEVCGDKIDNNCNGKTDETCQCRAGESRPCYPASQGCSRQPDGSYSCHGACQSGIQKCSGGTWGTCTGAILPQAEICDGKDNDCNGKIDESYADQGKPCTASAKGNCQNGTWDCQKGTPTCVPGQPAADDSICDNKDEDCDGKIDEDCQKCTPGSSRDCLVPGKQGICAEGRQYCRYDGIWNTCHPKYQPHLYENCDNGKDDDCNGQTDADGERCSYDRECYNRRCVRAYCPGICHRDSDCQIPACGQRKKCKKPPGQHLKKCSR